jgi:hypothetical protein
MTNSRLKKSKSYCHHNREMLTVVKHSNSCTIGIITFEMNKVLGISENYQFDSYETALNKWLQKISYHEIGEI